MDNIFINEALTIGINNFLNNTNKDDFITIIVSTLVNIYGQLDIINPYKTNSENSFDENITKFGFTKEKLSIFKQHVENFYLSKDDKPNKYFNEIEKELIDMYFYKFKSIKQDDTDLDSFKKNIQFEGTILNEIYSINKKEINKYFNYKIKNKIMNINYNLIANNILNKEAYSYVGYSYDNIKNMNEMELDVINRKVFDYFKIDINREDRFLRLQQAIEYYKDIKKENIEDDKIKENGYVEFILLTAFVSISILVLAIIVGVLSR
ncbi:MAG: hypothetical protein E7158_05870 [Firmicutes bacterium]|nr:hypothetical protein [Bacillota bacterium]